MLADLGARARGGGTTDIRVRHAVEVPDGIEGVGDACRLVRLDHIANDHVSTNAAWPNHEHMSIEPVERLCAGLAQWWRARGRYLMIVELIALASYIAVGTSLRAGSTPLGDRPLAKAEP